MAIFDTRTQFAYQTTSPTGTGESAVGDVIDTEVARDIGQGYPVYWITHTSAPFTSGGAATVQVNLRTDSDSDVSDGDLVVSSGDYAVTEVDDDWFVVIALPMNFDYKQYLGMTVTVGTAALTGGAFTSFLSLDPMGWKSYPDGQN